MAAGVTNDRQLGPSPSSPLGPALALGVIEAGVMSFESRGVDRGFRTLPDQAEVSSASDKALQQVSKLLFFKIRRSA